MTFATLFPSLEPWIHALGVNPTALAIKPFIPHFLVAHLVSLFVLGGCAIVLNLRLIGVGLEEPSSWVARRLRPILDLAVSGVLATGVLITAVEPEKIYVDAPFVVKMTALLAALVGTYGAALPLAKADGGLSRRALGAFVVSLILWGLALGIFANAAEARAGMILVIFGGGLLVAFALVGRIRLVYLIGLTVILLMQQLVTLGFIDKYDVAVLDPVNTAFSGAEAAWVLAFLPVLWGARAAETRTLSRLVGCATLLMWVTVGAAGRWIAFG